MFKMFINGMAFAMLCAPEGDGTGGGGGSGDANKDGNVTLSKADHAALLERIAKLESKGKGGRGDDEESDDDEEDDGDDRDADLEERTRKANAKKDKGENDQKALETALRFTMGADTFLKANASLLPKDIADIFKQADKENYANATEKANAIKAAVVKNFFNVQANLDLLTPGLKSQLEDYLKLTNNGRIEKASAIFDSIFEPALEMLRRTKRAEALSKGHGTGGDDAYKQKLMNGSRKHFLGEKNSGS